jgi:hypothetical protein
MTKNFVLLSRERQARQMYSEFHGIAKPRTLAANFMTTPIKEVIPREVPENVKPIIDWFANTLDELVNFGSNIMVWDNHPKTEGEENVPPTMLLRHFLDLIDSISLLVRQGTGDTSKILARAALEVTLNLEYLFENNTKERAMAFIVEDTIRQIKTVDKINPNTTQGKELHKTFQEEDLLSNLNINDTSELDDFIQSKKGMLQLPQFRKAYKEFERLKKQGEGNAKWYRYFDGPRNIESLAKYLKQKTLYEIIYRKWSGSVHGTDIYLGKLRSTELENKVDIVQIRYIKDVQEVVSYSLIMCLKTFRIFIANRIPEKQNEYAKWYLSIRDTFMKIVTKNYIKVE